MIHQRKPLEHWQKIAVILAVYDAIVVNLSYGITLWFRFDLQFSQIPEYYLQAWLRFAPIYTVFCLAVFWVLRLYKSLWEFASYFELSRVGISSLITGAFHLIVITKFFQRMPASYYVFGTLLQFSTVLGIRFLYRFRLLLRKKTMRANPDRIMLIGAGSAGQTILRDINKAREVNGKVVCIIDDDPNKWNRFMEGIRIVGGRDDILKNVAKYKINKIFLAIPTATAEERRDILDICKETGCYLKNLPGIYQLALDQVTVSNLRNVSEEDLLGREPIKADMSDVFQLITGKTVLVTGGGGSIGSELCRQIAAHAPKRLIIFDIYENNAYNIQLELRKDHPDLDLVTLIGSVRDSRRIYQVCEEYRPEIIYHAAAHKHVPLMEESPNEAIKNNAIGTYKTAYAAMMNGCRRFVLISTDKAVHPTNIMGASKRICEMIIQTFDKKIKEGKANELPQLFTHYGEDFDSSITDPVRFRDVHTEFVAVRFGNVLGSNGSVIPLFKKQIESGGPVTVTHPDIIRYFMTIPEAVSLVLLAGTYAFGGEIFVLDMGSPVKIDTLARNLIKLSGLKPDVDIKINYSGLSPGQKLYEEKLMAEEDLTTTENDMIFIGSPLPFDTDRFLEQLNGLMEAAYQNKPDIKERVAEIVGTYTIMENECPPENDESESKSA